MADDIKEPRSRYGWAWAIITIGMFLGLVFWVFNLGDELSDTPPTVEEQMTSELANPQVITIDITPDPIVVEATEMTALADLVGSEQIADLVGRAVDLQAVPVESVVGDMAFWIGDSADRRVYVLFDQVVTPDTPIEGKVDIDRGDRVNISGEVRSADSIPEGVTADLPQAVKAYIYATGLSEVAQNR
ncbi:MAG: hypothetical protein GW808_07130 [Sphingomonadales bacterium]|nr:hypothetical protein [Sphingomonadales bacterium]PIX64255.1 MAG: hypothetical protein COZ43_12240 [Sphingomonadales bacterium CG_4_10_14_3_um_filter_58_15]NCO47831.1 hypothetical protein [Sphingomonadales bacterium]NCP01343.1 hypothetical protein [Sphingomonadales bacterium]NCP27464.1 hypothetical protein [Sphingomonadales bacterium]